MVTVEANRKCISKPRANIKKEAMRAKKFGEKNPKGSIYGKPIFAKEVEKEVLF